MIIYIGNDHADLNLKNAVAEFLKTGGHEVKNCGTDTADSCDYPDFAEKVAKGVLSEKGSLGILICGTGIGMSIAANKIKGIRCALCADTFSARMARQHNNANILAIGARVTGGGLALDIVNAFVSTPFSFDARHQKRIDKMTGLEKE